MIKQKRTHTYTHKSMHSEAFCHSFSEYLSDYDGKIKTNEKKRDDSDLWLVVR